MTGVQKLHVEVRLSVGHCNVHVVVVVSRLMTFSPFLVSLPPARHADGLYDSYMRTDHILKEETDTNSPSGLPPMSKHTVSERPAYTHTHTQQNQPLHILYCKSRRPRDILFLISFWAAPPVIYNRPQSHQLRSAFGILLKV